MSGRGNNSEPKAQIYSGEGKFLLPLEGRSLMLVEEGLGWPPGDYGTILGAR